jgi:LysM repeat protein
MEDDINQTPNNMIPVALAVFGIVLGGAGLYFGLTANQRINSIDASVEAGTSSSARAEKKISGFDTQIAELAARLAEQNKTVSRLRVYSSQGEQAVKKLASELKVNREQIVKTAESLNELAAAGFRPTPSVSNAEVTSTVSTEPSVAAASPVDATMYTIVSGDTFGRIAAKIGVSVQAILDANPDVDPRRLSIGQAIHIPAR